MVLYSKKVMEISPSVTLTITAKAKKMKDDGIDIISFGAGEPDFNTPENIQEAAINSIRKGFTKYTPSSGILELKEAIVEKFRKENDLNYRHSQIIVSTGAKQCLANVFQAILNPGDEVILSVPYWVSYPELVKLNDGVPVFVETNENTNFKYSMHGLEKALSSKTKAILINSPNNPTGSVYNKEELEQISEFARKNDLIVISDEIYEKLIYGDEKHISIASLSQDIFERTIVVNGVSKSYSMTGWRIGYAAGNEEVIKLMSNIQSHTTSNPTSISQYAALEALKGVQDIVTMMNEEFKRRRDYMVHRINSISGISCLKPPGAFYVMLNVSKLLNLDFKGIRVKDSVTFSSLLLDEEKVAVIPGEGFGVENYVRLSYATSMDNITKGLDRIERFVRTLIGY